VNTLLSKQEQKTKYEDSKPIKQHTWRELWNSNVGSITTPE